MANRTNLKLNDIVVSQVEDGHHLLIVTALPDDEITRVAQLMSTHSIRRLPVCDGGHPIGVISLGDIAVEFGGDRLADMQRTPQAVLADISEAPPNR